MMSKIFEDHLSELQADMVSIALEYVDSKAEEIFIYVASENGTSAFDVFLQNKWKSGKKGKNKQRPEG